MYICWVCFTVQGLYLFFSGIHKLLVSRHVLFDDHSFHSTNLLPLSYNHASSPTSSAVVHLNTFEHPLVIPIPLPQVSPLLSYGKHLLLSPVLHQQITLVTVSLLKHLLLPY